MKIQDKIEALGGDCAVPGPSAMYATGFPSLVAAEQFIRWMNETYKILDIGKPIQDHRFNTYDVRYNAN